MDPAGNSNPNNPFRQFPPIGLPNPQMQAAINANVNDPNIYAGIPAPPAPPPPFYPQQPPNIIAALHELAALRMGDFNLAMQDLVRIQMQYFWMHHTTELNNFGATRQQLLPLARIKRVMKSNPAVKMISADTPVLFSKACELFIMELTFRAWIYAEAGDRKTLEKSDILNAIGQSDMFSFLSNIYN